MDKVELTAYATGASITPRPNNGEVSPSKSSQVTLGRRYSTARVSKRQAHRSAACLRAVLYRSCVARFRSVPKRPPSGRPRVIELIELDLRRNFDSYGAKLLTINDERT